MHVHIINTSLCILNHGRGLLGENGSCISNLAARLAVKRRLVGNQKTLVTSSEGINASTVRDQRNNLAFGTLGVARTAPDDILIATRPPDEGGA